MGTLGFYRFPALHNEALVFTAEGDLWQVGINGGIAQRLKYRGEVTSAVGKVRDFLLELPGVTEVYERGEACRKLELAAGRGDLDALVGPAHSLKSTSANLGALALSDIARTIEHGARQKNLPDPAGLVTQLAREFHRVEGALRAFIG